MTKMVKIGQARLNVNIGLRYPWEFVSMGIVSKLNVIPTGKDLHAFVTLIP